MNKRGGSNKVVYLYDKFNRQSPKLLLSEIKDV
jgi:hypothetical protein